MTAVTQGQAEEAAKLVRMANEIATAHRLYDEASAVKAIGEHLKLFWAPVMLKRLRAHIAAGAEGVDPRVVTALGHS